MLKPSSANYRVVVDNDDDDFTCDTGSAIALKASNRNKKMAQSQLDPFRFVDSEVGGHAVAFYDNGEYKKGNVFHRCCKQYKALLPYAKFQNVNKDLKTLSTLSDGNFSSHMRRSEAGQLFKDYEPRQLGEPSSYPNAFAELVTRRFWPKRAPTTPEQRLERMTRRFRKNIVKAADLGAIAMVAEVMRAYWLVLQFEGGEETNEIIPLADGISAVGTRDFYHRRLVEIGFKEEMEELIPLMEKFFLGNPDLLGYCSFSSGQDRNLTNRKTGSTLTPTVE